MVDSQQTSHRQESKGTVDMHFYLASCFKLWSTAMWLHRFWRKLQKWLRKVRLLSVGLNSLCEDSSSTGVFSYGSSNWQSLKNIILGEKWLWRASFDFCNRLSYQCLYDCALRQINSSEGHHLTFQYFPLPSAMASISDMLGGCQDTIMTHCQLFWQMQFSVLLLPHISWFWALSNGRNTLKTSFTLEKSDTLSVLNE